MLVMHDTRIKAMAEERGMIAPFFEGNLHKTRISRGLSYFGYDITLGRSFKTLRNGTEGLIIDPLTTKPEDVFVNFNDETPIVYPGEFILGHSVEYFRMPENVIAFCIGKSTYARWGIQVMMTPLEPGWEGQVTVEVANLGPYPVVLHAGQGIAQFVFLENDVAPSRNYATEGGKYMRQLGVVAARA